MLATLVKTAYRAGYSTAEVTLAQYLIGIAVLLGLNALLKSGSRPPAKQRRQLMLAGLSMGLTSVLYYVAIVFIDASIAVVLLMQSVWMGVLVEALGRRRFPEVRKIIAVVMVLGGTLLATGMISLTGNRLETAGIVFGILAAMSFSAVLWSAQNVATTLPPLKRSLYMLYGGGIVVLSFALLTQLLPYYLDLQLLAGRFSSPKAFDYSILAQLGIPLALLGTVIPPLLFNRGFPLTGIGLGSILSAVELPVSITFAFLILRERIDALQWVGVLAILLAVVLLNLKRRGKG